MKRFVAIISIIATVFLVGQCVADFDNAKTTLATFKALFWIVVGGLATLAFIEDLKNNEWPF